MSKIISADVVVVGAGVSGIYAAELFANQGLKTLLLDRQVEGKNGAQWINGVAIDMLRAADLPAPPEHCRYAHGDRFVFKMALGEHRFLIEDAQEIFDVDMRSYGAWFLARARQAGVETYFGVEVNDVELSVARLTAIKAVKKSSEQPSELTFHASLFVDASGLPAVLRKKIPSLQKQCPKFAPNELCSAAAYVYTIKDAAAALDFLTQNQVRPGDIFATLGLHGNYSLLRTHISRDLKEIAFLTGSLTVRHYPSAQKIIHDFQKTHAWVGSPLFGGSRLIPLRPPLAHLVHDGLALIGDSACQIYTPHASGIGIGLVAAKELVSALQPTLAQHKDFGALSSLVYYERNFHRNWLTLLASADAMRRLTLRMPPETMQAIYESGLINTAMVRDVLLQKTVKIRFAKLPSQIKALCRHPKLIRILVPFLSHAFFAHVGPFILSRVGQRYKHTPPP